MDGVYYVQPYTKFPIFKETIDPIVPGTVVVLMTGLKLIR
jgi:hypothetical protein